MRGMIDNEKDGKKKTVNKFHGVYFLTLVIVLYLILSIFWQKSVLKSFETSGLLLVQIAPLLLFVILVMGIINHFVKQKKILKYIGKESGIKGWFIAVSTGILSHGPVYIWYPLLKDLKDQGMRDGLIAVFLYNRAIKIPLLPLMIYYFGPIFVLILLIYMVIASIIEGKIVEKIETFDKNR